MKKLKKIGQGAYNSIQKNGDKKKCVRNNTTKYCWSHGMCMDNSGGCSWKKVLYQDGAIVGEKIYGSNECCN